MMRILGPLLLALVLITIMLFGAKDYLLRQNPWDWKLANAKSILYYDVTPENPLSLGVFASDRDVRLISHLKLPENSVYDPDKTYTYGMRISIVEQGETESWSHEYWVETRQSKDELRDGVWLKECAFNNEGDPITDDRLTVVHMPLDVPQEKGAMQVELLGWPNATLFVRAYRTQPRSILEITSLELSLTAEERFRQAERIFRSDWRDLTALERELLLSKDWQRLTALGMSGVDYTTSQVFVTTYRRPDPLPEDTAGSMLAPGQALAITLRGPVTLSVLARIMAAPLSFAEQAARKPEPEPPAGPIDATVSLQWLIAPDQVKDRSLSTKLVGGAFRKLGEFSYSESQPTTLTLTNQSENYLSIAPLLEKGERDSVLGEVTWLPSPLVGDSASLIQPKARTFTATRILPGQSPVEYPLYAGQRRGDSVRLLAYLAMTPEEKGETQFTIGVEVVDQQGEVKYAGEMQATTLPSALESYPDMDPASPQVVGDAQVGFLRFPEGQYTLRLSSPETVDVIVQTPSCLYCEEQLDEAYAVNVEPYRWRNESFARSRWMAVPPLAEKRLIKQGRRVRIAAQPRLDLPVPGEESLTNFYEVLQPQGTPTCSGLLEPLKDPAEREMPWSYGTFTEIRPGQNYDVTVPEDYLGRPVMLRYDLGNSERLGELVSLTWETKKVTGGPARMVVGELSERVASGEHQVLLHAPSQGGRYWINLPVKQAPWADVFAMRTVCRLQKDGSMLLPVSHSGRGKRTINVLAYGVGKKRSATRLSGLLDRGAPRLKSWAISTGVTPANKELELMIAPTSSAVLDAARSQTVRQPEVFMMTLFEEAAAGGHQLRLTLKGQGEVWVRAFASVEKPKVGQGYMIWKSAGR